MYGPRITGTHQYDEGAQPTMETMKTWSAYHPRGVFGHREQWWCSNWTTPSWASHHKRHKKTTVVMMTATRIPTFRHRILSWRLEEAETVETGNWGSNKQLAWYPLMVERKVTMLRVAEREEGNGRSQDIECRKEIPSRDANTAIHQKSNCPSKTLSVESLIPPT